MRMYSPFGPSLSVSPTRKSRSPERIEQSECHLCVECGECCYEQIVHGEHITLQHKEQGGASSRSKSGLRIVIPKRDSEEEQPISARRDRGRSPARNMYDQSADLLFRARSLHRDVSIEPEVPQSMNESGLYGVFLPPDLPLDLEQALSQLKRTQKDLMIKRWQTEWENVRPPKDQFWSMKNQDFAHEMRLCRENNIRAEQEYRAQITDIHCRMQLENQVKVGKVEEPFRILEQALPMGVL